MSESDVHRRQILMSNIGSRVDRVKYHNTTSMNINIVLRRFLHNHGNIATEGSPKSRDYALLLFRMTSRVLYSAQYQRQHRTLHAFEQFGALYMHNHDDKYPSRPGFEPGTPRLQAPVDTNEYDKHYFTSKQILHF